MEKSERRKKLEQTLKDINKSAKTKYFDYANTSPDKEVIPFGIEALDNFYGGGVPLRKYTVDFGSEDTGKSTRALHLVANAQNEGKICVYIDLERKFDKNRALQLGVNLDELVLSQNMKTAEDAMDSIRKFAQEKVVDLVIVDSIQAMSPKGEQETKKGKEKSIENDEMALLARKLGKFFRVTSAEVFNANMGVYLIGQVRQNLGGFFAFADLSGGNALKHWMSLCIFSRKGQKSDFPTESFKREFTDKDGKVRKKTEKKVIGFDCVLKIIKSHIADSARENEDIHLPFYYETGFKEKQPSCEDEPTAISAGEEGKTYSDKLREKVVEDFDEDAKDESEALDKSVELPLKEGSVKKGGVNELNDIDKPDFTPPTQQSKKKKGKRGRPKGSKNKKKEEK